MRDLDRTQVMRGFIRSGKRRRAPGQQRAQQQTDEDGAEEQPVEG